jgi:hypothetical protein
MNRFLLAAFCLLVTGCASSGSLKSSADTKSGSDLKSKEYEALKEDVTSFHASSIFGSDKPWIFTSKTVETIPAEFAESHCPIAGASRTEKEANACARLFNHAAFNVLSENYFAAETSTIVKKCASEMLVCNDLMSLEAMFRNMHNENIEKSKNEKLASLDEWRSGKLTDDELKADLHLDFAMKDGKFVVSLPSVVEPSENPVVGAESP